MPRVKANGIEFEYDERGPEDGDPVLLVMGFTAQMTNWPESFCDAIAEAGYRVIRFDNRDIGLSHQCDDKGLPDMGAIMEKALTGADASDLAPYTLDTMARDTAEVIKVLRLGPVHLVGASMGGMIAQLTAIQYPDLVKSLVPIMTSSGAPDLPQATPEAMEALTAQPESPAREHVVPNGLKTQRAIGSHPDIRDCDEVVLERIGLSYDRAYRPMGAARQYAAILAQPRWHNQLSRVTAPTMVLHGKEDPLIPIACGRDIADRISGAKMVEIDKWGHDMSTQILPLLTAHIIDFLMAV